MTEKCTALKEYVRKEDRFKHNNLRFSCKKLEKEQQIKYKYTEERYEWK